MNCYICDAQITFNDEENHNNLSIGVKYNDQYYCISCHKIVLFSKKTDEELLYDEERSTPTTHTDSKQT